ncbi:uncharacterized protein ACIBXB_015414 isoform 2-T2 [Morphnus guianensis]
MQGRGMQTVRCKDAGCRHKRMRDAGCGDAVGRGTGMRGAGAPGLLWLQAGAGDALRSGHPHCGSAAPPLHAMWLQGLTCVPAGARHGSGRWLGPSGELGSSPRGFYPRAGREGWVARHAVSHPKCHPCPKANRADVAGPHRRTWAAQRRVAPAAPFDGVPAAGRPRLCFRRHPTKGRPRSGASAAAGSESGQDEKSFPGPARPAFARERQEQNVPQRPSRGPDTTAATCTPRPREGCWHGAAPRCGLPWRREKHPEVGLLGGFPAWGGQQGSSGSLAPHTPPGLRAGDAQLHPRWRAGDAQLHSGQRAGDAQLHPRWRAGDAQLCPGLRAGDAQLHPARGCSADGGAAAGGPPQPDCSPSPSTRQWGRGLLRLPGTKANPRSASPCERPRSHSRPEIKHLRSASNRPRALCQAGRMAGKAPAQLG